MINSTTSISHVDTMNLPSVKLKIPFRNHRQEGMCFYVHDIARLCLRTKLISLFRITRLFSPPLGDIFHATLISRRISSSGDDAKLMEIRGIFHPNGMSLAGMKLRFISYSLFVF